MNSNSYIQLLINGAQSNAAITILIVFVLILFIHHAILGIRHLRRVGIKRYVNWIFMRDIRVFVILIFYALWFIVIYANWNQIERFPNWAHALIVILPLYPLSKGFGFPQILLLHSFDEKNYSFCRDISKLVPLCNTISLFPGRINPTKLTESMDTVMLGIGSRLSSNTNWHKMIRNYMKWAELIIMDLSHGRTGLIQEIGIAKELNLDRKVIFVCSKRESIGLETLTKIKTCFPKHKIYQYNINPNFGSRARTANHPIADEILGHISTHRFLPLLPMHQIRKLTFKKIPLIIKLWGFLGETAKKILLSIFFEITFLGVFFLFKGSSKDNEFMFIIIFIFSGIAGVTLYEYIKNSGKRN